MTNEDATEFCENCQRHVAAKNFVIHSVHCQRNIELCRLCKEPLPTRDMEQHLAEAHSRTTCNKCLQPMEQWQLHVHKETCNKRLTSCQFCLLSLPFDEIPEHEDYCGSRTQSCPECRQFVMKRNEKDHQEVCIKVQCGNRYQAALSNASGDSFSVIRNTFLTPSSAKGEANEAASSSVERIKQHDYGYNRNIVQDAANKKASVWERKSLNKEQMRELIQKTKDVFVECYRCNSNVLSNEMKNHLDECRVNQQLQEEHKHYAETSSSLYHGYPPSYDEVVGNARWSSPHSSQKNQEQEASKVSIQAIMEECPVCLKEFPTRNFSDHLQYCSERQTTCPICGLQVLVLEADDHAKSCAAARHTAPTKQHFPSNFDRVHEQRGPSEQSYTKIIKNSSKNKIGHESRTGMDQNSPQLCLETESEICPICKSKISSVRFEDHLKRCSERKIKCHFCNQLIYNLDNEDHLKECYNSSRASAAGSTKWKSAESPSFSDVVKSSSNASTVNSCGEFSTANFRSNQKHQEPMQRDEPQQCPLCDKETHPTDKNHHARCLKKSYVCRFCGSIMLPPKFKEHIDAQCNKICKDSMWKTAGGSGKRGKKNSPKERNYGDFFAKIRDTDSFSSRSFHDHFSRNTDSNKGAISARVEPIMLPCEFCEKLVPEEEIILHQSGCRPDLVSYTAKSFHEDDLYGSNLDPSDEPVRRKLEKLKLTDDVLPGEYLSYPPPDDRPIPARKNTSHDSILKEEVPRRKEIENEQHLSLWNSDLPKVENAFNLTHSVVEDKFDPKPLLQHRLEDENGLERYLEYLNVDSGGESDSKEELDARGGEQRLGMAAKSSECFNDRFCRESKEIISNGNIVEGANQKFAYHANGRRSRSSNETSACQKPEEEPLRPYQLFEATCANSYQDAKEKSYYDKKDYCGKR